MKRHPATVVLNHLLSGGEIQAMNRKWRLSEDCELVTELAPGRYVRPLGLDSDLSFLVRKLAAGLSEEELFLLAAQGALEKP